jgi:hypothetical protein
VRPVQGTTCLVGKPSEEGVTVGGVGRTNYSRTGRPRSPKRKAPIRLEHRVGGVIHTAGRAIGLYRTPDTEDHPADEQSERPEAKGGARVLRDRHGNSLS